MARKSKFYGKAEVDDFEVQYSYEDLEMAWTIQDAQILMFELMKYALEEHAKDAGCKHDIRNFKVIELHEVRE